MKGMRAMTRAEIIEAAKSGAIEASLRDIRKLEKCGDNDVFVKEFIDKYIMPESDPYQEVRSLILQIGELSAKYARVGEGDIADNIGKAYSDITSEADNERTVYTDAIARLHEKILSSYDIDDIRDKANFRRDQLVIDYLKGC